MRYFSSMAGVLRLWEPAGLDSGSEDCFGRLALSGDGRRGLNDRPPCQQNKEKLRINNLNGEELKLLPVKRFDEESPPVFLLPVGSLQVCTT